MSEWQYGIKPPDKVVPENTEVVHESEADLLSRVQAALKMITRYGGVDGGHHKQWLLDYVVRLLTGDGYEAWVKDFCAGEEGPKTYEWNEGVAP